MTSATNYLPKPNCSLSSLSWILPWKMRRIWNNARRKHNYLIFKGAFPGEIILRRLPNENIIRQFGRVKWVGLESQLSLKSSHTYCCYTLRGPWSLQNHRCRWHGPCTWMWWRRAIFLAFNLYSQDWRTVSLDWANIISYPAPQPCLHSPCM